MNMIPQPEGIDQVTRVLSQFSVWAVSVTAIVAALSAVFKPVRSIVAKIGKRLFDYGHAEREKKLLDAINDVRDDLSTQIKEIGRQVDTGEIDRIRYEVLDFCNSIRNGRNHSKEEYAHIIELNTKYQALMTKTGETNGVFDEDYAFIMQKYHEALDKNSFLN